MASGKLKPGQVLAERFALARRLGAGSSGVVWAARDLDDGKGEVALKILHPQLGRDPNLIAQLAREARVLARLEHPHIARALSFEDDGDFVFLAMELLDGEPLHEVLGAHTRDGRYFGNRALAQLLVQTCAGVAHAHAHDIVHRDLKPHNVIVSATAGGFDAKVVDFGIARLSAASLFDATTLGRRMGSLFYMSPEQTRGEPADVRADVFALGSILFELLTLRRAWAMGPDGHLPAFDKPIAHGPHNALAEVFTRIAEGPRPRPSVVRPELPPALDTIVARALAVDPSDRYPSVAAFANEARAALDAMSAPLPAATTTDADPTVAPDLATERTTIAPPDGLLPPESLDTDRRARPEVTPTQAFEGGGDHRLDNVPVQVDLQRPAPVSLDLPPSGGLADIRTVALDAATARADQAAPAPTRPLMAAPTKDVIPPTQTLDPARPRPASPPGFGGDLEEAGPTVREPRPSAASPPAAPTQPSPRAGPSRRVRVMIGLLGGAALGGLLLLTVDHLDPAPAPVAAAEDDMPERPKGPRVQTEPVRHPELLALLSEVKAHPQDRARMDALVKGILQATQTLEDRAAAKEINEIASLSATVRNIEGLATCVARLEAAP